MRWSLHPSKGFLFHSSSLFPSSSELPPVPPCLAFSGLRDFSLCSLRQEILPQTPRPCADYPFELACGGKPYSVPLLSWAGWPSLLCAQSSALRDAGFSFGHTILGMTCLYPLRLDRWDRSHTYFHQGFVVLSPKASTWPEPWEMLIAFVKQKNGGRRDGFSSQKRKLRPSSVYPGLFSIWRHAS